MYKRQRQVLLILMAAFFLSGASALIYQVLWLKKLILTFGSTTIAVSTILACFMGGLALGSYLMANRAFNVKKVLVIYAILEFIIALYAFFLPDIFNLTDLIYLKLWPLISDYEWVLILVRFILVSLALIVPTTIMGATLPLIVKYFIDKDEYITKYVSILYAVNTFGAVFGSYLAGFVLIEALGLYKTNLVAISLNVIAALIAIFMERRDSESIDLINNITHRCAEKIKIHYGSIEKIVLWSMLFSGFTSMMYEIIWTRQLVLVFGSTTYSYTCILVVFLVGIAFGSFSVRKSFKNSAINLKWFAVCQFLLAVLIIAGSFYYTNLFYGYYVLSLALPVELFSAGMLMIGSLLIFPVAAIYGVLFPLSVRLVTHKHEHISERTGYVYSFNTVGCILGSLCCGFFMIPFLGLRDSLVLGAIINMLIAVSVFYVYFKDYKKQVIAFISCFVLIGLFLVVRANWQKSLITAGMAINNSRYNSASMDAVYDEINNKEVVYYKEGYHSTIGVLRGDYYKNNGEKYEVLSLYNNGKVDASTSEMDMRTQTALAYFPALIAPKIEDILVIGYGSGITVALMEKFPIKSIEVVELEKEVVDAGQFFNRFYGDPLADPRFNLIIDDARDYLRVTDKKYDVIISEPSNLWINGVANLFTQEYYKSIKSKLNEDGVLFQWMHVYLLDVQSVKSVLKALKNEFKYVYILDNRTRGDITLVASMKPIKFDLELMNKRINTAFLKQDLKKLFDVNSSLDVLNMCISNGSKLNDYLKTAIPNTDDNSLLAYKAAKAFFKLRSNQSLKKKTEMELLLFNLIDFYKEMKGLTYDNVRKPPVNLYEMLSKSASRQLFLEKNYPEKFSVKNKPMYEQIMINYAKKLYKQNPDSLKVNELIAMIYIDLNKINEAIEYLEKAALLKSKQPVIYYYLASIYSKNTQDAGVHFDPSRTRDYAMVLKTLNSKNVDYLFFIAESYYYENKFLEAKKYYDDYRQLIENNNIKPLKNFESHYKTTIKAIEGNKS